MTIREYHRNVLQQLSYLSGLSLGHDYVQWRSQDLISGHELMDVKL